MKLNPVIHTDKGLNFDAANDLTNVIATIQGKLLGFLFALLCAFIYQSIKILKTVGRNVISPTYLLVEVILLAIAAWVAYYQINRIRSVVIKIGKQVSITDETVSITPFTFGLFFWNKKSSHQLAFKINELRIRKTDSPLRFTWALDNRVFELRDNEKEAYIVFDYFDETLEEKLMDILVKVTPPELLLPGRMRHY